MMKLRESINGKLKKRGGFTLIEMLTVVAIVAILVVISIPMMTNALDDARKAADDANLRAAKAEAAIEWLTSEDQAKIDKYYDAENGKLVDATEAASLEAYGKYKDGSEDHTTQIIKVDVDTNGDITVDWDAIP